MVGSHRVANFSGWRAVALAGALAGAFAGLPAAAPAYAQATGQPPAAQPAPPAAPASPAERALSPQEITLSPVPVLTLSGSATWEEAYDKLVAALGVVDKEMKRLGLTRAGNTFVVYSSSDDLGFEFEVQVPFSGTSTQTPQNGTKLGASHAGKAMKFTHAGSFADMDNTYEQIANYLDEKNVQQTELYIEQYRSDLLTAAPDALEIDILVPLQ